MIETVTKELLAARNADGGWGTFAERPTNIEATAFALMGLAAGERSSRPIGMCSLARLLRRPGASKLNPYTSRWTSALECHSSIWWDLQT